MRSEPTWSDARPGAGGGDALGRDLVHIELRLSDPATRRQPMAVHDELGVFFGGIVPEMRDGDVLRLQWLNGVEADPSDIAVASDFGRELLAYVFERKHTESPRRPRLRRRVTPGRATGDPRARRAA
jgi:hypothetical protein